ncbi:hypothetical protein GCM10011504_16400 [Siccirubricoccus deserti]|uniref:Uncharacterized protein n=1 Tax=Siccirubricoccus deserti TaxID=2013562 RepID=A0A9X0UCE1_9PROT|nr:hypothetical protein [Siccirubricoccus deserti]MBC4015132.1 hypothetical protein [Siccirubricoccus deserti]GGC38695.1 hypothetical protein GCM10011504_16400 [Siccirubricoccus deserti]
MLVRVVLVAAGALAAVFVARDAPNFGVVEAMVGIALIADVVAVLELISRR